ILALAAACTLASSVAIAAWVARHGELTETLGGWQVPLGIRLRADGLAAATVFVVGVVGALTTVHALLEQRPREAKIFLPLWAFGWAALNALALSADLFNLYVSLEITTLVA